MRDYLFRGKRIDNGEWVEGMPCSDLKGGVDAIQSNLGGGIFDIYPESFGQYTGMNEFVASDKSFNRPLFEGDIVEVWSNRSPKYTRSAASQYDGDVVVRATICFRHGSWTLNYENKYNESLAKLRGKETDERTVAGYWELYSFGPHNSNEEWIRKNNYKWHDIKKIGTVFENADLLESD